MIFFRIKTGAMTIHNAGRGSLMRITIILILINIVLLYVLDWGIVTYVILAVSIVIFLFVLNFFKSPKRIFSGDKEISIVSPADGKIVAIEEVYESEYFGDTRILVSVFMSIFNVHANWYPVNGRVILKEHHKGRFRAAYLPKSSTENERTTIVLQREDGVKILARQVAGALAQRIVTYFQVGEEGRINRHFGFIKFGSRVDLYLPLDTKIEVVVGQKVTGCRTIIGSRGLDDI